MIVCRICALCNEIVRGTDPCTCFQPSKHKNKWNSVQIGMIDGYSEGYFPPEAGPYVNPGKSLKRACKNKNAWNEMIKRSEGRIGDAS